MRRGVDTGAGWVLRCGYWNAIVNEYEKKVEALTSAGGKNQNEQIRELLTRAITCYTVSAFPGDSSLRMQAYHKAKELLAQIEPMYEEGLAQVSLFIER